MGSSGELWDITNPARHGQLLARVPWAGKADVDRAVAAARAAFGPWRAQHFVGRQRALIRIADAIEARAEELARLTALDTGNALRTQARPEVATLSTCSGTSAASPARSRAPPCRPVTTSCSTPDSSRWASSAASCRGIHR